MEIDVACVIVDCDDAERLAHFWTALLGVEIDHRVGPYVFLGRSRSGVALGFSKCPGSSREVGRTRGLSASEQHLKTPVGLRRKSTRESRPDPRRES
jgi:hypothetical protein